MVKFFKLLPYIERPKIGFANVKILFNKTKNTIAYFLILFVFELLFEFI
jgi:hypothetical protein